MTNRYLPTAMIVALALPGLAACSRSAPENLPIAPGTAMDDSQFGPRPGSREDFLAHAGADTIFFATDSQDLDPEARAILDSQAVWLVANPDVRVTIEGHCDERGTREYNLALGERRANAASLYLAARGVAPARMSIISYGKERPAAQGSDPGSWSRNRRSVTVVPI